MLLHYITIPLRGRPPRERCTMPYPWVFITGGCCGRGVQWMGAVLYNQLVTSIYHDIIKSLHPVSTAPPPLMNLERCRIRGGCRCTPIGVWNSFVDLVAMSFSFVCCVSYVMSYDPCMLFVNGGVKHIGETRVCVCVCVCVMLVCVTYALLSRVTPNLPTNSIPTKIAWLRLSGRFPMGLGIPPLRIKLMLASNPLSSIMLVWRLAVYTVLKMRHVTATRCVCVAWCDAQSGIRTSDLSHLRADP